MTLEELIFNIIDTFIKSDAFEDMIKIGIPVIATMLVALIGAISMHLLNNKTLKNAATINNKTLKNAEIINKQKLEHEHKINKNKDKKSLLLTVTTTITEYENHFSEEIASSECARNINNKNCEQLEERIEELENLYENGKQNFNKMMHAIAILEILQFKDVIKLIAEFMTKSQVKTQNETDEKFEERMDEIDKIRDQIFKLLSNYYNEI